MKLIIHLNDTCPKWNIILLQTLYVVYFRSSIVIIWQQAEQRWAERYEFDVKGFAQRRSTSYSRYSTACDTSAWEWDSELTLISVPGNGTQNLL